MFDGQEHVPKLLPCSHTICLECLTRCPTINHLTNATNYLNHINHLNHPNATINPPTDPDLNVTNTTRIVATFARDSQFRCPVCRELITIPVKVSKNYTF